MNEVPDLIPDDHWILSRRGKKNIVDPQKPYAWMIEKERTVSGKIEDVAVIFLTNCECPFTCLMCDLWKNTTDKPVPVGAIPNQIEWALKDLPHAKHLKLYNSGSFFDSRAINEDDYKKIASLVKNFETVIVESHPRMIDQKCLNFRKLIKPDLQVSLGLEVIQPEVLNKLNKKMTPSAFRHAVGFLRKHDISSRAFILLRPPFMSEQEGIFWAESSIYFAFDAGVECCTVIPVRSGNGAMEELSRIGYFSPPSISSLEKVLEYGINLKAGRVFADVWDLKQFSSCDKCLEGRISRIVQMNLTQTIIPPVSCTCK